MLARDCLYAFQGLVPSQVVFDHAAESYVISTEVFSRCAISGSLIIYYPLGNVPISPPDPFTDLRDRVAL